MGIINATSDSFSGDGLGVQGSIARGLALLDAGADMLDIGGESTRPGARPVNSEEEIRRVEPVIVALSVRTGATLSVDTMKPAVARRAVAAGAAMWNDVTALCFAADSADTAAELGCQVVLMHMQGTPRTMQIAPAYDDVVGEVLDFLARRTEAALAAGVRRSKVWLDPGIGFGKSVEHNLALLADLPRLVALGFPVLLGVSRKGFIRGLDAAATAAGDRLGGSLAAALAGARAGVTAVRVHDVRETIQALAVDHAIRSGRLG
ncbi:MAG TPA: dihydropteroate synthase [Caulobacteraceae bacterium]